MDEFQLIEKIKQKTYKQSALIKGIGDDAAVIRESTDDIVIAKDTFVEGIHFNEKTMAPDHVGYRIVAANISDLAAMGAIPLFYLVSIVIPNHYENNYVLSIYDGMKDIASIYNMDLIGGDTVSGNELVITVTVMGKVAKNKARYRHTAQLNDIVFVTGKLGDSAAGLHLLLNDKNVENDHYFINRHQMPQPRVQFVQGLQEIETVTLNDVSDGIASESHEIAKASDKSIVLLDYNIPIHNSLKQFSSEQQTKWKYFGGEDFEIIGTVPRSDWPLVQQCAVNEKIKVTEIGYVTELKDYFVYIKDKNIKPLRNKGYTHLK